MLGIPEKVKTPTLAAPGLPMKDAGTQPSRQWTYGVMIWANQRQPHRVLLSSPTSLLTEDDLCHLMH